MQPNSNAQQRKDAEELHRYRLSMDKQLTTRPTPERLKQFQNKLKLYLRGYNATTR